MIQTQPYEQKDFSGGFTDNIYSNDPRKCAFNDNILVDINKKAFQRPGSDVYSYDHPQIPEGSRPLSRLFKFHDQSWFFAQHSRELYYFTDQWQTFSGPTDNPAFAYMDETGYISPSEWQGHFFIADSQDGLPIKIYPDEIGDWQLRTAGLPGLAETQNFADATVLASAIALANDLKTKFLAHIDDYFVLMKATSTDGTPTLTSPFLYRYTSGPTDTTFVTDGWFVMKFAGVPTFASGTTVLSHNGTTITLSSNVTGSAAFSFILAPLEVSTYLHDRQDTVSRLMVSAVASATDLASLITLTNALTGAYTNHLSDAVAFNAVSTAAKVYHDYISGTPSGDSDIPLKGSLWTTVSATGPTSVTSPPDVTTLIEACERIDDIKQKMNWHDSSISHFALLQSSYDHVSVGQHQSSQAAVGFVDEGVRIAPNLTELLTYANNLKTSINTHFARGNNTHNTADTNNTITSATATDLSSLVKLIGDMLVKYYSHLVDASLASPNYHYAQDDDGSYLAPGTIPQDPVNEPGVISLEDLATTLEALVSKYNTHVSGATAHHTVNDMYIVQTPQTEVVNYAFCYKYEYQVGDVTYIDRGPVTVRGSLETVISIDHGASISHLPVLSNGTTLNYDTSNIEVEIYRTQDVGTEYRLVDSVTNGTTTYSDVSSDAQIEANERLYTTGGVVENDPPPSAKCIHIVGGKAYYGNILEDGVHLPHRVRQSINGDPDSCPGDFFDDMEDDVIGISSVATLPIVFGQTAIYRLEGEIDLLGRGSIIHKSIQNPGSVGLVSENSIIQTDAGILFAGTDGFYLTNGYTLTPLSLEWTDTYLALISTLTKASKIQGTYDSNNKLALWTVQRDPDGFYNDAIMVLDLNFPLDSPCWSSWSNGSHFSPTSILMFGSDLLRGDSRGYLFQHDDSLYTDPYVNVNVAPLLWGTVQVKPDYVTCAVDFGSNSIRKWGTFAELELEDADLFLAISTTNDRGREKSLAPIRRRKTLAWGDLTINWGEPTILWDFEGNLERKRRMPAKSLRFTTKQMRYTSDLVLMKSSETTPGPATVDQEFLKVTLDDNTYTWLSDCESYFIAFDDDDYEELYEINQRYSDTVIYINDPNNLLSDGPKAWRIYGHPKGQYFRMLSHAVHAGLLSKSQMASKSEVAGEP